MKKQRGPLQHLRELGLQGKSPLDPCLTLSEYTAGIPSLCKEANHASNDVWLTWVACCYVLWRWDRIRRKSTTIRYWWNPWKERGGSLRPGNSASYTATLTSVHTPSGMGSTCTTTTNQIVTVATPLGPPRISTGFRQTDISKAKRSCSFTRSTVIHSGIACRVGIPGPRPQSFNDDTAKIYTFKRVKK